MGPASLDGIETTTGRTLIRGSPDPGCILGKGLEGSQPQPHSLGREYVSVKGRADIYRPPSTTAPVVKMPKYTFKPIGK